MAKKKLNKRRRVNRFDNGGNTLSMAGLNLGSLGTDLNNAPTPNIDVSSLYSGNTSGNLFSKLANWNTNATNSFMSSNLGQGLSSLGVSASGLGGIANTVASGVNSLINPNGNSTGVGNALSTVGSIASNIPGVGGLVGAGVNLVGGLVNTLFGSNINEEFVNQTETQTEQQRAYTSDARDNSSLLSDWSSYSDMEHVSKSDVGSDGLFSNKAKNLTKKLNANIDKANTIATQNLTRAARNVDNTNDALAKSSFYAYGGYIPSATGYDLAVTSLFNDTLKAVGNYNIKSLPNSFNSINKFDNGGNLYENPVWNNTGTVIPDKNEVRGRLFSGGGNTKGSTPLSRIVPDEYANEVDLAWGIGEFIPGLNVPLGIIDVANDIYNISKSDNFTRGDFINLGLDALGLIPGVKLLTKGASVARKLKALKAAEKLDNIAGKLKYTSPKGVKETKEGVKKARDWNRRTEKELTRAATETDIPFIFGSHNKTLNRGIESSRFTEGVLRDVDNALSPWGVKYNNIRIKGNTADAVNDMFNLADTYNEYSDGGGIHIKKKNRGKFTDYCGGKVTSECITRGKKSSNPVTRKRATFAANARKWHADGGPLESLVADINKRSKADFVQRLLDPNRDYINDWESDNIATHKLGYAEDDKGAIVFPNVQRIDGKLYDFTDPKNKRGEWDALDSAIERGDTLRMTPEQAEEFTKTYKKYYPKGKTFKAFGGELDDLNGFVIPQDNTGVLFPIVPERIERYDPNPYKRDGDFAENWRVSDVFYDENKNNTFRWADDVMHDRAKNDERYIIPYLPDKEIRLTTGRYNTGRISTNVLDSIYDAAMRTGTPLEVALGLAGRESTLGIGRGFKRGHGISATEMMSNWQQINPNLETNRQGTERRKEYRALWNKYRKLKEPLTKEEADRLIEIYNEEQEKINKLRDITENPIDNALKYYNTGNYNKGDKRHSQMVEEDGRILLSDPAVRRWLESKQNKYNDGGSLNDIFRGYTDDPVVSANIASDISNNVNTALINKTIADALERSRTRTEPSVPILRYRTPEEKKAIYDRYEDLIKVHKERLEELNAAAKENPSYSNTDRINDTKAQIANLEHLRDNIKDCVYGNSCIYTATDNYGSRSRVSGNETFAADPSKYGFKEVSEENMQPGDLVQDWEDGYPFHALIFDSYREDGTPLFNYSSGGSDSESYKVKKPYPMKKKKVYRYIGFNERGKGGSLYNDGGALSTHGGIFSNGMTYINEGNTHEENPFEGVQLGVDNEGTPNLVEEGEVIFNDYVFSDRMKLPEDLKKKYKFRGTTYADAAKYAGKESEERPNDPISKRGLDAAMQTLAYSQEEERMKKEMKKANRYARGGKLGRLFDGTGGSSNSLKPGDLWYSNTRTLDDLGAMTNTGWIFNPINKDLSEFTVDWDKTYSPDSYFTKLRDFYIKNWDNPIFRSYKDKYLKTLSENNSNIDLSQFTLDDFKRITQDKNLGYGHLLSTADNNVIDLMNTLDNRFMQDTTDEDLNALRSYNAGNSPVITGAVTPATTGSTSGVSGEDNNSRNSLSYLRYAPALMSGIATLSDLFTSPDYSAADRIAGINIKPDLVYSTPVGQKLRYTPLDKNYYANKLARNAAATRRGVMDSSGGNRAAMLSGLLAADYSFNEGLGSLARHAEEYNNNLRKEVADFNRATDIQNANSSLQAQTANAQARANATQQRLAQAETVAKYRQAAKDAYDARRSNNLNNFITNLGNIGWEEQQADWLNNLADRGVLLLDTKGNYTGNKTTRAKGGKLKRRKRRIV